MRTALCTLVIALLLPVHAFGQSEGSNRSDGRVRTILGAGFGFGSFPGAFDPACRIGLHGRVPAASFDLRGGLEMGQWRAETRTSLHGSIVLEQCGWVEPMWAEGVHTDDMPYLDRGAFKQTDIRIGHISRIDRFFWDINAGAGWTWGGGVPVVVIGTGVGVGRKIRVRLDGDWIRYRAPYSRRTAEWRDGEIVREIDRVKVTDWRSGNALRLGVEFAFQ